MWIEMTVEDRISDSLVAIPTAAVSNLQGVRCARNNQLAIEVMPIVAVRRMQPLVRMEMVYMRGPCSRMKNPELDVIIHVAVVHVRRIVREKRLRRLRLAQRGEIITLRRDTGCRPRLAIKCRVNRRG